MLETANESILKVVAVDEQGSQLFLCNQSAFADHIHPILKDIHDRIRCPFAVIGSWPAQQFAHTCRESNESIGPDLECMVGNDINCFFGEPGNGPFAMEGMPQKELINDHEVNWVKVIISVSCRILKDSDLLHCVHTFAHHLWEQQASPKKCTTMTSSWYQFLQGTQSVLEQQRSLPVVSRQYTVLLPTK